MDRQCEDRAHRIGQVRDVHIYRLVSAHSIEEALLAKANHKRRLDHLVIQQGHFDWSSLFGQVKSGKDFEHAVEGEEDNEDQKARQRAEREERERRGEDWDEFGDEGTRQEGLGSIGPIAQENAERDEVEVEIAEQQGGEDDEDEVGSTVEYMLSFVRADREFFDEWRV
jgi:helicase SWR1